MSKLIRLVQSPFQPPIDHACGLTFQIHVPYSKDVVTLLVNPSVSDFKDKDGNENVEIRQLTVSQHTSDTKQISLDFKSDNVKTIKNDDKEIEVKLMKIDTENIQGQDFLAFELFVSEVE
jgi:hypothetical protein